MSKKDLLAKWWDSRPEDLFVGFPKELPKKKMKAMHTHNRVVETFDER